MPDPMPEHRETPPQWPPLAAYDEPTTPPEPAEAEFRATTTGVHPGPELPVGAVPSQAGAPDEPPPIDPRLSDRLPVPAPPPETKTTPAPPDTHGRGVRMAIYGFGGLIVVGLITAIVLMAGSGIVPGIGGDEEKPSDRLMTDSGEVNEDQYRRLAEAVGDEDWIKWRYGPAGDPEAEAPEAKQPKTAKLQIPGSKIERPYQHGDGSSAANPRNVQGQLGYVAPDVGANPPVDHVTATETTDTTLGFTPRAGGRFTADAQDPDLNNKDFKKCVAEGGPGRVVATERSHGAGYAAHSVVALSSGVIATSGISGAQQGACLKLPDKQVPTSVAVTPGNEFALVTVWDTDKVRGRVAVIALADRPGTYGSSWPATYPGLPNPGHFGFAKLLGFVELKDIKAPTGITVGTDADGANAERMSADLSTDAGRQPFADSAAKKGFAVVAATAEKKLEWIDLSPLLGGFHKAYFEGDPKVYASPGADPKQWPPAFATKAELTPAVTTATKLKEAPMSVAAVAGTVYVGGGKGTVSSYTADPAAPKAVGKLSLDGPATCLTPSSDGKQVLATSRQDRSVNWLKPGKADPTLERTLRDKRLVDPICAVDNDDLSTAEGPRTTAHTVSVADFGGGALHTFRYGEASMADGTAVNLKQDAYEYGGAYKPEGKPFTVTTTADNI